MMKKRVVANCLIGICLVGCASQQLVQRDCVVTLTSKLANADHTPGKGMAVGAGAGAGTGAVVGAVAGGILAAGATIVTFGLAAPAIPALVGGGALLGGGSGAVVGAGAGYAYDYSSAGSGLYQYNLACGEESQVKLFNQQLALESSTLARIASYKAESANQQESAAAATHQQESAVPARLVKDYQLRINRQAESVGLVTYTVTQISEVPYAVESQVGLYLVKDKLIAKEIVPVK